MPSARTSRRGLAPLELVLWLPLLMFVMALMVIIGNAVVWKVRTATVSRHALWRARPMRTADVDPPPATWPRERTSMAVIQDADLLPVAAAQPNDAVAHGPLGPFGVRPILDIGQRKLAGDAELARIYPMLARMGEYRFDVEHPMLVGQLRYWEIPLPGREEPVLRSYYWELKYRRNTQRRILYIYELPKAPSGLSQAFSDAVRSVLNAPFRGDLDPLDRDPEVFAFYGDYIDFHPEIGRFSSLDEEEVYRDYVEPLIDRIEGLPAQMTQFFLNMYRQMAQ